MPSPCVGVWSYWVIRDGPDRHVVSILERHIVVEKKGCVMICAARCVIYNFRISNIKSLELVATTED